MDKTLAGVIGVVGALSAAGPSAAATAAPVSIEAALQAHSYADLLKPIPNALAIMKASAAVRTAPPAASYRDGVEDVQYDAHHHHHHHHHDHHHHHHHYDE
jgi:ABC-type nickel/cobalt efflux system permease component RcnA